MTTELYLTDWKPCCLNVALCSRWHHQNHRLRSGHVDERPKSRTVGPWCVMNCYVWAHRSVGMSCPELWIGGPVANFIYNLRTNADPGSNKKGSRTFDDFALGLMLAEIGTGVPPYFNPDYDYYSRKQGNLQNEKGIFYILQPKKVCEKADLGIQVPKEALAYGQVSIKSAVKEVVGRSLYYLQNQRHFIYTSGLDQGIGNVQLLTLWPRNEESCRSSNTSKSEKKVQTSSISFLSCSPLQLFGDSKSMIEVDFAEEAVVALQFPICDVSLVLFDGGPRGGQPTLKILRAQNQ